MNPYVFESRIRPKIFRIWKTVSNTGFFLWGLFKSGHLFSYTIPRQNNITVQVMCRVQYAGTYVSSAQFFHCQASHNGCEYHWFPICGPQHRNLYTGGLKNSMHKRNAEEIALKVQIILLYR
jgi:hypothetical protein